LRSLCLILQPVCMSLRKTPPHQTNLLYLSASKPHGSTPYSYSWTFASCKCGQCWWGFESKLCLHLQGRIGLFPAGSTTKILYEFVIASIRTILPTVGLDFNSLYNILSVWALIK
jgi:hypothetical protein